MLVASLALLGVLGAGVAVALAFLEQRRLEQALEDVRLADLKARTSLAEAERAADWLSPITDPITAPFAEATRSVAGALARRGALLRAPYAARAQRDAGHHDR